MTDLGRAPVRSYPPMADASIVLTEAQISALAALRQAEGDYDARRSVEHWIHAWDKALGRGGTVEAGDRIRRARQFWGPYLFADGAGI